MARLYTAEELLTAVRDIGMIPDTGSTGTEDADLLKRINEALLTIIYPRVLKTREDYFVRRSRTALAASTSRYRLPHRAMYGKLRDLWWIDDAGDRYALHPVPEEQRNRYQTLDNLDPAGFFLEGDYLVLVPEDGTSFSGYLELYWFMRPGELVKSGSYVTVATVTPATKTITYTGTAPTAWAAGTKIDIHSAYSGAEHKCWDLTISSIDTGTKTIIFSAAIDGTTFGTYAVAVGDYVCNAEEAALPAAPRELHPLIAQAAAMKVAESIGDANATQMHGAILATQLNDAVGVIESRVEGKPMRIGGYKGMIR